MRFQMEVPEQLLSFKLTDIKKGQELYVTIVYASTDRHSIIALWDDLYHIAATMTLPWLVGGRFQCDNK